MERREEWIYLKKYREHEKKKSRWSKYSSGLPLPGVATSIAICNMLTGDPACKHEYCNSAILIDYQHNVPYVAPKNY